MATPIPPSQLKPAPLLIFTLLNDIMVKCVRCKRDIRAGDYDVRECSTAPTTDEVKMASRVLVFTNAEDTGGRVKQVQLTYNIILSQPHS